VLPNPCQPWLYCIQSHVDRIVARLYGERESGGVESSMATRGPALEFLAESTGETRVTWEHHARMVNDAPGRFSTALGRGVRHMDMTPEWLASTLLSGVIGDPKNAAVKVPLYGNLKLSQSRFEYRETQIEHYQPRSLSLKRDKVLGGKLGPTAEQKDWTFFDALLDIVSFVSQHWNDEFHKYVHHSFKAEIYLGGPALAKISRLTAINGLEESWVLDSYALAAPRIESAEAKKIDTSAPVAPMQHVALITGQHITMLATLLKTAQAQVAPPLALDVATYMPAPATTNENGAPARAPRTRLQDQGLAAPAVSAPEDTREREISQASLSHGPGPSPNRHRKDLHHGRTTHAAAGPGG